MVGLDPLVSLLDLSGRGAAVTGAAQGFGYACARRLAEAGARVLLVDRRVDRLADAEARLAAEGHAVVAAAADVTSGDDVERFVARAWDELGTLDILVNNAGVFSNFRVQAMPPDEFRRIVDVNMEGVFRCTQATVARLLEHERSGAIVNVTSIDALHPTSVGMSHYTASKHAIWGLTKSLALELGPYGIRVNAVAPGPSLTEGSIEYIEAGAPAGIDVEAQWEQAAGRVPLRRWAEPDEIARAVVFLASDLASYVTGAQLVVDGGYLAA